MIILQDGDILLYRIGHAGQRKKYNVIVNEERLDSFDLKSEAKKALEGLEDGYIESTEIPESLIYVIQMMRLQLYSIKKELGCDEIKIYLSGENNFRDKIATIKPYKGNRDRDEMRPYWFESLKEYLIDDWDAEVVDGMEADDKLGIEQYLDFSCAKEGLAFEAKPKKEGTSIAQTFSGTIISTIDKDLNMIPGWHYNFVKKEKFWVDEFEALRNFYTQMLVGDTSDNILGVPGIGAQTTEKLLAYAKNEKEMYKIVHEVYQNNRDKFALFTQLDVDEIIKEQANLLWIRRSEDDVWKQPKL